MLTLTPLAGAALLSAAVISAGAAHVTGSSAALHSEGTPAGDYAVATSSGASDNCRTDGELGDWGVAQVGGRSVVTSVDIRGLGTCVGRTLTLTLTTGAGSPLTAAQGTVATDGTASFTFAAGADSGSVAGFTVTVSGG